MSKFAENIQATIWTDGPEQRREFRAWYLFEEGFSCLAEAVRVIELAGLFKDGFRYVVFRGNIYPVSWHDWHANVVLDRVNFYVQNKAFTVWETHPLQEITKYDFMFPIEVMPDENKWQDGIPYDLKLADPNICAVDHNGDFCHEVEENQAIILFGMKYFISEIAITTDNYIRHVFSHYFSDLSCDYKIGELREFRNEGYTHYNPFSQTKSRSQRESKKKRDVMIGDAPVLKHERLYINRETKENMTYREHHPAPMDGSARNRRRWQKRY